MFLIKKGLLTLFKANKINGTKNIHPHLLTIFIKTRSFLYLPVQSRQKKIN